MRITANRTIGTRIQIDGEAQFKNTIKSLNQEMRVLTSEMGACTSGFDKNNASITDLRQKGDTLTRQIEAQKQKIQTLTEAEQAAERARSQAVQTAREMAEQYGENSTQADRARQAVTAAERAVADYRVQCNNSIKALNNMEQAQEQNNAALAQMEKTNFQKISEGFKQITAEAAKAAGAVGKIGIKALTTSVEAGIKGLTAYAGALGAAATAAFGLAASAGAAADDLNTLSKQTGISTEQLQKMTYAAALVDVDVETTTKAMTKLTKNMGQAAEGSKTATEAFSALGVKFRDDVTGELRDNEDVFNDAITALGKIENSTERDALAMDLFGKSAQDLNPLILGGAEQLKKLGDNAEAAGLIMSQDALDNLNAFNDSIDILKANTAAAGNVLASSFADKFKVFTDLIGGEAPKLIKNIADIFGGKDIDKNITALTANLKSAGLRLTQSLTQMIPTFIASFNGVITAVVQSITATLSNAVKGILPTLITGFVSLIQSVISEIPVLVPIVLDGAITLFRGILDGLNAVTDQLIPMLPILISSVVSSLVENISVLGEAALKFFGALLTAIPIILESLIENLPQIIMSIVNFVVESIPKLIEAGISLFLALVEAIPAAITTIIENLPLIISSIITGIISAIPQLLEASVKFFMAIIEAIPTIIAELIVALPMVIKAIIEAFQNVDWGELGTNIIDGIGSGFMDGVTKIGDKIKEAGNSIVQKFKDLFGIASPSKVMKKEVGGYLADGVGEGFTERMKVVSGNMSRAIPKTYDINVDVNPYGAGPRGAGAQNSKNVTFTQNIYNPTAESSLILAKNTRRDLARAAL